MRHHLVSQTSALQSTQLDYLLVDGSGSMMGHWTEVNSAIRLFIRTLVAENIHSHGIVQVFDGGNIDDIQRDALLSDWPLATMLNVHGGLTPLYDAVNLMMRRLAELDPPKASIIIVTDGGEMGSKYTSAAEAKALLDWGRAKGWQITFLGADFNNWNQAKALGATERNTLAIQKTRLIEAGKALADKRLANIRSGTEIQFSDQEKSDFGGYLTSGDAR